MAHIGGVCTTVPVCRQAQTPSVIHSIEASVIAVGFGVREQHLNGTLKTHHFLPYSKV